MKEKTRYSARGASSTKEDVHAVVDRLDQGLFPGAFCKLTEDRLTGDPEKCNVIHADGSGTKSILAYLHYRETGDASVFRGIAQDSIVMNLDDLLCIGVVGNILISSTINRHSKHIPREVLAEIIEGTEWYLARLRSLGVSIWSGGGETADVGDLTPTVLVDSCAVAVLSRSRVIDASKIGPGLAIVGLSSTGRATYEDSENSGIGSNGLTGARHDMLDLYYAQKYPEVLDPQMERSLAYVGPYRLGDALPGSEMTVGNALLSPTRTYAPVVAKLIQEHAGVVRGLIHCSGGGQSKCLRFGRGVRYVKDNLFEIPPLFRAIQEVSGTSTQEMYQTYNMGHRMEVYCEPDDVSTVIAVANGFDIEAQVVGRTEVSGVKDGGNELSISVEGGEHVFWLR